MSTVLTIAATTVSAPDPGALAARAAGLAENARGQRPAGLPVKLGAFRMLVYSAGFHRPSGRARNRGAVSRRTRGPVGFDSVPAGEQYRLAGHGLDVQHPAIADVLRGCAASAARPSGTPRL